MRETFRLQVGKKSRRKRIHIMNEPIIDTDFEDRIGILLWKGCQPADAFGGLLKFERSIEHALLEGLIRALQRILRSMAAAICRDEQNQQKREQDQRDEQHENRKTLRAFDIFFVHALADFE